jgi:hypothetical protein
LVVEKITDHPAETLVLLKYQLAEHYQLPAAATEVVIPEQTLVALVDPVADHHM